MQTTAKLGLYAGVLIISLLGCEKKPEGESATPRLHEPVQEQTETQSSPVLTDGSTEKGTKSTDTKPNAGMAYSYATSQGTISLADSTGSSSSSSALVSSSAAVETGKDTAHKFIRTADLKFKVKNVISATYAIEDITQHFGGFVSYTSLASSVDNKTTVAISADSSLETTWYTLANYIQIRVPNTRLDSTLKTIAPLIDFLDSRIIKANDISREMLSNQWTQNRITKHQQRLTNAIDTRGKKLNETTSAEDDLVYKQEMADNARMANLNINDQVKFSTITLNIYQRQSIKRELILNDKNVDDYEPGFISQIGQSFKFGKHMMEAIFLFIAKLWGLILFALIMLLMLIIYERKIKTK